MMNENDKLEQDLTVFELLSMMRPPQPLHVWNVKYSDKNGEICNVQYTTATRDEAIRLFHSEQDKGDVIKNVRKVREKHV